MRGDGVDHEFEIRQLKLLQKMVEKGDLTARGPCHE